MISNTRVAHAVRSHVSTSEPRVVSSLESVPFNLQTKNDAKLSKVASSTCSGELGTGQVSNLSRGL